MVESSRTITVAAGQIEARLMTEADATLDAIERTIDAAARRKADLLVLPECAYPAYLLGSAASYRQGSHLPSDGFLERLVHRAARHRMHIVCGFVEDTGQVLHNSAILLDDRGAIVGVVRKRFLWNADREWYAAGEEIRACETALGRIGIVICAETRVPEILATLAHDGAELIAMPTCWINGSREVGVYENPQVTFLIEARAREFGVPFVCADKSGIEMPGVGYVGQSRIVGADGALLAEAPPTGEALISASLTPQACERAAMSHTLRDRLLAAEEPRRLGGEPKRKLTVAAFPADAIERWTPSHETAALQSLAERGVALAVAPGCSSPAPGSLDVVSGPGAGGVTCLGSLRVAFVTGRDVRSFAASRVAALDGAEALIVLDAPDDLPLLRTRALENRVFVLAAGAAKAVAIGPGGEILARADADGEAAVAQIDPSAAWDKCVAPRTDIFAERRVGLYRF